MIWLDGTLHEGATAPFDLADRGLLLADGLFETISVFGGTPFRLGYHLDRLAAGARTLGFAIDRTAAERAVAALVARAQDGRGVVRVTVTRGSGPRGLAPPPSPRPTTFAALAPWTPAIAATPVRLATLVTRRNETSPLSRLKPLAYLDSVLGMAEARAAGADDGLFLNTRGAVATTTMANVFAVTDGEIVTPAIEDGVLAGTIRALLLERGAIAGLPVRTRTIEPAALRGASEIFVTNSVRLISPVTALDGAPVATGPVARAALEAVLAAIATECGDSLDGVGA